MQSTIGDVPRAILKALVLTVFVETIEYRKRFYPGDKYVDISGIDIYTNAWFGWGEFTARHNLSQVVKAMAEAGDPTLRFDVTTVIYGGRRLVDHWRLGTQNFVKIATLTAADEQTTIDSLEEMLASDPKDKYASSALARHRELSKSLNTPRQKWDIVVLQSYRDDLDVDKSLYVQYAPRFAELIASATFLSSVHSSEPVRVRVLTYNIHHGKGTDGKIDLARIAAVIKRLAPDVVALQEVDQATRRSRRIIGPCSWSWNGAESMIPKRTDRSRQVDGS